MSKPGVVLLALVLALTTVSLAAYAAPAPAPSQARQVFNWRMQTHHPPNSKIAESGDMFVKDVERLSGGRLKIARLDGGALIPNADIFQGVRTGMVEMGWSDPAYHVGFMPENAISTAPFMFQNIMDAFEVYYYRGVHKFFEEGYAAHGVHFLTGMSHYTLPLLCKKPIRRIADYKGVKVRTIGARQTMMRELGAVPVTIPLPEVYTAFAAGTIDCATNGAEDSFGDAAWTEVAKYIIYPPLAAYPVPVNDIYVNPNAWNSLPDDLKAVLETVGKVTFARFAYHFRNAEMLARAGFDKQGVTRIYLPQEDHAALTRAASVVWTEIAKQSARGREIVKIYTDYMREMNYTDYNVAVKVPK